ncbi:hypothetical protein [Caulobacter sp. 17J65-9]|uniref:hypothetical protein n=1 Tax=Caulobacter sp. 17J65-9 TaxID=2709382 RepID=UPI0013CA4682|nr:hypothetical protein [Caulobacter sp. 17J65-9]NEX92621.1 hypothetical protein [Caulobacter sp. 17J65-9]
MDGFEQAKFFSDTAFQYGDVISQTWTAHVTVSLGAIGYAIATRGPRNRGLGAGWCVLLAAALVTFYVVNLASLSGMYDRVDLSGGMAIEAWGRSGRELTPEIEQVLTGPRQAAPKVVLFGREFERVLAVTAALDVVLVLATGLLLSRAGRRKRTWA